MWYKAEGASLLGYLDYLHLVGSAVNDDDSIVVTDSVGGQESVGDRDSSIE
jgi:hypothetical protein